jgi:hypothetical protein
MNRVANCQSVVLRLTRSDADVSSVPRRAIVRQIIVDKDKAY